MPAEAAPEILEPLKPTEAVEDESVTLECKIKETPSQVVEWFKNGSKLKENRRVKTDLKNGIAKLTITQLRSDDKGDYKIVVRNDSGSSASTANLVIKELIRPEFKVKLKSTDAFVGDEVRFEVQVKAFPRPVVEWYHASTKLSDGDRYKITEDENTNKYTLVIIDAKLDDDGSYKCVVSNSAGKATNRCELSVKEKPLAPTFEGDEPGPMYFHPGDEVNINVKIKAKPKPDVKWYKDGKPLRDTSRMDIRTRGDSYYIVILSAKPEDTGIYKCEASNKLGKASRTFDVKVQAAKPKGEAPSLDGSLKPLTVTVGEDAKLVCKVSGKPEPKIEWFKNSKPIKPDSRIKTDYDGTTSTLQIKNTTIEDKGDYKCIATNEFGTVESDADVIVKEKGERPTITEKLKEMKIDLGNKATFKVVAKGNPKPEVEWLKGDKTIEDKGRFIIDDDEENGVFKLIIDDVQPEDAGIYNCVVFNEVGEVSTSGELHVMKLEVVQQVTPVEEVPVQKAPVIDVTDQKPVFKQKLVDVVASPGNEGKFDVVVEGDVDIEWIKDDKVIEDKGRFILVDDEGPGMYSLVIDNIQPEDAGEYECVAINDFGETACKAQLAFEQNGITPDLIEEMESTPIALEEVEGKPREFAPEVIKALEPAEVTEGDSLCLQTKVSGMPTPTVEWMKDNVNVKESRNIKMEFKDDVAKLIIKQTKSSDKGEYKCVVRNDLGSSSTKAKVTVRVPVRPDFTVKLKPVDAVEGGEAKFEAKLKGEPRPEVEWYKGTTKIVDEGRYSFEETDDGKYTLIIVDLNRDDSGAYKCVATNEIGKATTRADLSVKERQFAPEIESDLQGPIIVNQNDEVNINVTIKGKPKPEVKWYKDSKPLRDTTRLDIRSRGDSHYILILSAKPEDKGTYKCEATNKLGKSSKTFEVQVKAPKGNAPIIDSEMKSLEIVEGKDAKLTCKISGKPKPTVEWFKDDQKVKLDDRVKVEYDGTESTLTIVKTVLDDEGLYKCVATNEYGTVFSNAELLVDEQKINVIIEEKMKDVKAAVGKEAKFDVRVSGSPKPEVEWTKDAQVIEDAGRYLLIDEEEGEGSFSLVIDDIKPEDAGVYKCIAMNETGKVETSGNLVVEDDSVAPQFDKDKESPITVSEGESFELNAQVSGKPLPEIEWYKDDKPIEESKNVETKADGNHFKLIGVKVTLKDTGKYKCVARSTAGVAEKTFEVIVESTKPKGVAPTIVEDLQSVEVSEGDNAILKCKVSGTPSPVVEWYKGTLRVKESRRIKSELSNDVARLTINSTQANDKGEYKCVIRNDLGSSSSKCKLTVKVPIKPDFTVKLKPVDAVEGDEARFEVKLKGEPRPKVEWFKGNTKIVDEGRYSFEEADDGKYILIIVNLNRDDSGAYKCVATNEAGKATTRADLNVKERQFAPEIESDQQGPIIVNQNDEVNIKVTVKGKPKPEVKWHKDNKPLKDGTKLDIRSRGDSHYIVIVSAKSEDQGIYKCEATSKLGKASKTFDVQVKGPKGEAPVVKSELKPKQVTEGQECKITCEVTGKPEPTIKWMKDGKELQTSRRVKPDFDGITSTLHLKDVSLDDEALYECVATNELGKASSSAELLVDEKRTEPEFTDVLKKVEVNIGDEAKFKVRIIGNPKPEVDWFKDGKLLEDGDRVKIIDEEDGSHSLVIESVVAEDVGTFKCVAFNDVGEVEASAPLSVREELEAPEFVGDVKSPIQLDEGDTFDITIQLKGKPLPDVEWYKDNKPIRKSSRIDVKSEDAKFTLVIVDVTPDDSGMYKCVARSKAGSAEKTIKVVVERKKPKGTAPEIIDELRSVEVNEGENATLNITLSGKPTPTVEWLKDGFRIKESRRVKPTFEDGVASLAIKQTRDDDRGEYKCIVKNDFGKIESTCKLTVIVPKRPEFKVKMKPVSGMEGGEARFDVEVEGLPKPEVEWFFGSTKVVEDRRFQTIEEKDNCFSLIISDLRLADSGSYKCIAVNDAGKATSRADLDVKERQFAPEIDIPVEGPIVVKEGEEINFEAIVKGNPRPEVDWFKDERMILETSKRDIRKRGDSHQVVILSSTLDDTGTYKCVASNRIGQTSKTIDVQVNPKGPKGEAPVITSKLKPVETTEGEEVVLVCEFSGRPVPTSEWTKDGLTVKSDGRVRIKTTDTSATISIKETILEDEGIYKCVVTNELGSATTSAEVLVNEKGDGPHIEEKLKDVFAVIGEEAVFKMRVSGTAEVDWFKDEKLIQDSGRFALVDDERTGVFALELDDVQPEDVGTYKCVVFNKSGEASSKARLLIQEESVLPTLSEEAESAPLEVVKPSVGPEIIEPLKPVEVMEEEDVILTCKFSGEPTPTVEWQKNGIRVRESYRIKGKLDNHTVTLSLKQIRADESGEYKCTITNEHGSISSTCKVTVLVPEKPVFKKKLVPVDVAEGESVRFDVEIEGFPKPVIEWYSGISKITSEGKHTLAEDGNKYSLFISATELEDAGAYKCVASNNAGKSTSRSELAVKEREFGPEFVGVDESPINVDVNQEVKINVTVKGKPKPDISWYKDGKPVGIALNTEVRSRGQNHSFTIVLAKQDDSGIYKCEATNKHGRASKSFTVTVGEQQKPTAKAPVITSKLAPLEVTEGEEAKLTCSFTGTPGPICEWFKDGVDITSDNRINIEHSGTSTTLTIKETTIKDEGFYRCVVRNEIGSVSTTSELIVNEKELGEGPRILSKLNNVKVKIGQEAVFKLRVSLPAEVDWYKGEQVLEDSGRFVIVDDEDESGLFQLIIENVQPDDVGRYKCVAFNEDGEVSCKAKLEIHEDEIIAPETVEETEAAPLMEDMKPAGLAPEVIEPMKSIEVSEGDNAVLKCKVTGTPIPSIEWLRDDVPILGSYRVKADYTNEKATLTIKQVRGDEAGSYKCVIRNDYGETSTSAKLKVKVRTKPNFIIELEPVEVEEGEEARFEAHIEGYPRPDVEWFKGTTTIDEDENHEIFEDEENETYTLVICNAKMTDHGNYKCVASNEEGRDSSRTELIVKEGQYAPRFEGDAEPIVIHENSEASISTVIKAKPKPEVTWYKDGVPLRDSITLDIRSLRDVYYCVILRAKPDDEGLYKCEAKNVVGSASRTFEVKVKVADAKGEEPSITRMLKHVEVSEGQPAKLVCKVTGKPEPTCKWTKNGITVRTDSRVKAEFDGETCSLNFKQTTIEDDGFYKVVVCNDFGSASSTCQLLVNEVGVRPKFEQKLKSVNVREGEDATFIVEVSGLPEPEVQWLKDTTEIKDDGRYEITEEDGIHTLLIKNCTLQDTAKYQCVAFNSIGETASKARLDVEEQIVRPEFVGPVQGLIEKEEGESMELSVEVTGIPKPEIEWYHYDKNLMKTKRIDIKVKENQYTLFIVDLTKDDSGMYRCVARNKAGQASRSFDLQVQRKKIKGIAPDIIDHLKSVEVFEGQGARLTCTVSGKPEPTIEWYKDGLSVKDNRRVISEFDGNTATLTLRETRSEDSGYYKCMVRNDLGSVQSSSTLTVIMPTRPEFVEKLRTLEVSEGEEARLEVRVKSYPKPEIEWYQGSTRILDTARYEIIDAEDDDDTYSLIINKCKLEDSSMYKCVAINQAGKSTCRGEVIVKEKQCIPGFKDYEETTTVIVNEGEEFKLTVCPTGHPKPEISWYKDGVMVVESSRRDIRSRLDENVLIVFSAKRDDAGSYRCEASNRIGKNSKTFIVKVRATEPEGEAPRFTSKMKPLEVTEGEEAKFVCLISGHPKPTITWSKEGQPISEERRYLKDSSLVQCTLSILGTKTEDEGVYKCVLRNDFGTASTTADLTVTQRGTRPKFEQKLNNVEGIVGQDVQFQARVHGTPAPEIHFFHENEEIEEDERFSIIEEDEGLYTFIIRKTKESDAGQYKCTATNSVGEVSSRAYLRLEEDIISPELVTYVQGSINLTEGDDYDLSGEVTGKPKPEIEWYKNDRLLWSTSKLQFSSEGNMFTMAMRDVVANDSGLYKCVARNKGGAAHKTFNINVEAKKPEGDAPELVESLKSIEVNEGEPAELKCIVTGRPTPTLEWFKDGLAVKETRRIKSEIVNGEVTLTFKESMDTDAGNYKCVIRNELGKVTTSARLDIKTASRPEFKTKLRPQEVTEGENIRLDVRVIGFPTPTVEWYRGTDKIDDVVRFEMTVDNERGAYSLKISDVTMDDAATYKCVAINRAGKATCRGELDVKQKQFAPRFEEPEQYEPIILSQEADATIKLTVLGNPQPSVTWYKDGIPTYGNLRLDVRSRGNAHFIKFMGAKPDEAGTYKCEAKNRLGTASREFVVKVEGGKLKGEPPEFYKRLQPTECFEGDNIRLVCQITGKPQPTVEWFKDDRPIFVNWRTMTEFEKDVCTLRIKDAKHDDEGVYKCVIENTHGSISSSAEVTVSDREARPQFLEKLQHIDSVIGETATFRVRVSGSPTPQVEWFKNDEKIESHPRMTAEIERKGRFSLLIENLEPEDEGLYKCVASNELGEVISKAELRLADIMLEPSFIGEMEDSITVFEGNDLDLTFYLRGRPMPNVTFYKDELPVIVSDRLELSSRGNRFSLTITNVVKRDAGNYKVVAKNKAGTATKSVDVIITPKRTWTPGQIAPEIVAPLKPIIASEGSPIKMRCRVSGEPAPTIEWFKNSVPVVSGGRVTTGSTGDMQYINFTEVASSDEGRYRCVATNEAGSVYTTADLTVESSVSPPSFKQRLVDVEVSDGEEALFSVQMKGPVDSVKWYHNDLLIDDGEKYAISRGDAENEYVLIIPVTEQDDEGTYQCVARNESGKATTRAELEVLETVIGPSFVGTDEPTMAYREGDDINFDVEVRGRPAPEITWYKDELLVMESRKVSMSSWNNKHSLKLYGVTPKDSGFYKCVARNKTGSSYRLFSIDVTAKKPRGIVPEFFRQLKKVEVVHGTSAKFEGKVSGHPEPTIEWLKDEKKLVSSPKVRSFYDGELCKLTILETKEDDQGEYTCVATNEVGSASSKAKLIVSEPLVTPEFKQRLQNTTAVEGKTAEFVVRVIGNPEPTIEWTKGGKRIRTDGRFQSRAEEKHTFRLVIDDVRLEDAGTYKCIATNEEGRVQCSARLAVTEKMVPPKVNAITTESTLILNEGENLELTTTVEGNPVPDVEWHKDGSVIRRTPRINLLPIGERYNLSINSLTAEDTGVYKCVARSPAGTFSKSFTVVVESKTPAPLFIEPVQDIDVVDGREARMVCRVRATPRPMVEWLKDGRNFKEDYNIYTEFDGSYCTLVIKKAKMDQDGIYECVAKNKEGRAKSAAKLTVKEDIRAPVFDQSMQDALITEGDKVTFKVQVSGKPEPTVEFYKDDEQLVHSGRIRIEEDYDTQVHKITIRDCKPSDSGEYMCVAKNKAGESTCYTTLNVRDKIIAPTFTGGSGDVPIDVWEGVPIQLVVEVKGKPPPTIEWFKENRQAKRIKRVELLREGNKYMLVIPKAVPEDSGEYHCEASSSSGVTRKTFKVSVNAQSVVMRRHPVPAGAVKPEFIQRIQDQEIVEGSAARLTVQVRGTPEPDVDWYKDNRVIREGGRIEFAFGDDGSCILVIRDAMKSDRGRYKCVASNAAGKAQCSAELFIEIHGFESGVSDTDMDFATMREKRESTIELISDDTSDETHAEGVPYVQQVPPEITLVLRNKDIMEGGVTKFACRIISKTSLKVEWFRDDLAISKDWDRFFFEHDEDLYALNISQVKVVDSGPYKIVATNEFGSVESIAYLNVVPKMEPEFEGLSPRFTLKPKDVHAVEGTPVRLECRATGAPMPEVRWYRDNEPLIEGDKYHLEVDDGLYSLTISDVTEDDSGHYKVIARNTAGREHATADVTVQHPATEEESDADEIDASKIAKKTKQQKPEIPKPEILLNLRDRTVVESMSVRFNCRTTSNPKPYILWYKDGHALGSYGRYEITSVGATQTLVIRDCQVSDAGLYRCVVSNLGGETETTAKLTVEEIPKAKKSIAAMPPRFEVELRGAVTVVGSTARLCATVAGHPTPIIEWYKDDKEVLHAGRMRFEEANGEIALVVRDVRLSDQGRYKCVASNRLGKDFSSSSLLVTELIPSDEESEEDETREHRIKEAVMATPRLPIENISVDIPVSQSTPLRPRGEPPEFIRKLRDRTVSENDTAEFVCLPLGNPEPTYQWFKDDKMINENEKYKLSYVEDKLVLNVMNCTADDEGMYKCEAVNQCGKDMTTAWLTVKVTSKPEVIPIKPESLEPEVVLESQSEVESGPPVPEQITEPETVAETAPEPEAAPEPSSKDAKPFFVRKAENCTVKEGGRARFDVKVSGYPEPFTDWFTRGKMIEENEVFRIEETEEGDCALVISDVDREDAGIYKCVAENDEGTVYCEAELIVEIPDDESETESVEDAASKKQPSKTSEPKPRQPEAPKPAEKPIVKDAPPQALKTKTAKEALPKPTFLSELVDKQVKESENLSLDVKIPPECKAEVSWFRDDQKLKEDHRITIISAGNLHCLTIFGVTIKDEAVYKVVATNSSGTTTSDCEVLIEERVKVPQFDSRRLSHVAPEFLEQCESQVIQEGGTAIFKIRAVGSQPLSIRWFKDQQTIKYGNRIKMSSDGELCTLKITPVEKRDEGLYMCVISNKAGTTDCEVLLTVEPMDTADGAGASDTEAPKSKASKLRRLAGEKPSIVTPLRDLDVFEGDDVLLEVVSGPENVKKVEWFKDNELIRSQPRYLPVSDGNSHSLKISNFVMDDEGIFKCVVLNDNGIASCSAEILVDLETDTASEISSADETELPNARRRSRDSTCAPEFQQELKEREVLVGDTIHFDVKIVGKPDPKITWSKDGKDLKESSRITFVGDPTTGLYSLLIKKACLDDEGDYRVVASSAGGSISCQAELLVEDLESEDELPKQEMKAPPKPQLKDEAPVFTALLKDRSIENSNAARFDARVIGNPTPTVTWYKDDQEITPTKFPHMKVLQEGDLHSLLITEGQFKDSGIYKCVAKNSAGQDSTVGNLFVEEPGSKPNAGTSKPTRKSSGLARIEDVLKLQLYVATDDFKSEETGKKFLEKGDKVEVLDTSRPEFWLVRRVSRGAEIGFVRANVLERDSSAPDDQVPSGQSVKDDRFVCVINYTPESPGELYLREGDTVKVLDSRDTRKWLVSVGSTGEVGWAPAVFLESSQLQTPTSGKDEALARRVSIVSELIETERQYVNDLRFVAENHLVELEADDIPECLVNKKEAFFANLKEIYDFHSNVFLPELEACVNKPDEVSKVFEKHKSELAMYIDFLQTRPGANEILEDQEVAEFWEEFKEDIEDRYFISDYFLKPAQRLTDYQRLLRLLLMYTVRAKLDHKVYASTLKMVSDIPREANERIFKFHTIEHYNGEIPLKDLGRLIRKETVNFWEERARGKGKARDLFLFEKALVNTKRKEEGKKYQCKNVLKLSTANVGLTEDVEGESNHFMVWVGSSMANALVLHTFETKSEWSKQAWIRDLKKLLKLEEETTFKQTTRKPVEVTIDQPGPLVMAFKETVTSSSMLDIVSEVEKQYVAITPPDSPEPPASMNVELGGTYHIHDDTLERDTHELVIGRGEPVRVLRSGKDLFFVQTVGDDKNVKEGWVPASWLVGDEQGQQLIRSRSSDTLSEASEPELKKLAESDECT